MSYIICYKERPYHKIFSQGGGGTPYAGRVLMAIKEQDTSANPRLTPNYPQSSEVFRGWLKITWSFSKITEGFRIPKTTWLLSGTSKCHKHLRFPNITWILLRLWRGPTITSWSWVCRILPKHFRRFSDIMGRLAIPKIFGRQRLLPAA